MNSRFDQETGIPVRKIVNEHRESSWAEFFSRDSIDSRLKLDLIQLSRKAQL